MQTKPSKVPFIKDLLTEKNQLFIALTETWLKTHTQAELEIDGYKIFRSDRIRIHKRGRYSGGSAVYIRNDVAASVKPVLQFTNGVVEVLSTYSKKENLYIAVIYRQPDNTQCNNYRSTHTHFKEALSQIEESLNQLSDPIPDILYAVTSTFHILLGQLVLQHQKLLLMRNKWLGI